MTRSLAAWASAVVPVLIRLHRRWLPAERLPTGDAVEGVTEPVWLPCTALPLNISSRAQLTCENCVS